TIPTQTEIKPVETPTPVPTVISTTTISTVVATPVQVDTLPAEQYVDLQLSKERPDYTLHLIYNGGKGEGNVVNVLMKATLSDGRIVEKYMNDGQRKPRRGDEIIIQGTRGSDRVEVFVTSAGRTYKVLDQQLSTHTL
ncbi:MAG: hypothetical protein PHT99_05865, partial [Methanoregula sp.]|nr:hypothetical protein [Methanoregula sp.]